MRKRLAGFGGWALPASDSFGRGDHPLVFISMLTCRRYSSRKRYAAVRGRGTLAAASPTDDVARGGAAGRAVRVGLGCGERRRQRPATVPYRREPTAAVVRLRQRDRRAVYGRDVLRGRHPEAEPDRRSSAGWKRGWRPALRTAAGAGRTPRRGCRGVMDAARRRALTATPTLGPWTLGPGGPWGTWDAGPWGR